MAGIYVNDEGTWKLPKSIWINQLGTWRVCKNVYVNSGGAWKELIKTVDLIDSQNNFNLYEYLGSPTEALSVIFNIPAEAVISSYDAPRTYNIPARTNAFTVGNFPSGSTVLINNNGYISGGGGFGGSGAGKQSNGIYNTQIPGARGGDGSYGIVKGSSNSFDITIVNTGTIAGGGGGGGGAGRIDGGGISTSYIPGANGGYGAGITGYSDSIGQLGTKSPSFNPKISGNGGNCGQNGTAGGGSGSTAYGGGPGGLGKFAINTDGIDIAVSGTILGGVG